MRLEVENSPAVALPPQIEDIHSDGAAQAAKEALNMGIRHAQSGDRVNARIALLRATELDRRNESAWLWLASISEYPEELMAFLDNVLSINPDNERATQWMSATKSLLAKTFLQRGSDAADADQPMYAEDCFRKALEYDENCTGAWLWLVSLSKDKDEKVNYLHRVLEIDPQNAQARSALETIRVEEEQTELAEIKRSAFEGDALSALSALENFNNRYAANAEAWMLRSHLAQKPAEKLAALSQLLEIDPDNEAAKLSFQSLSSMFPAAEAEVPVDVAENLQNSNCSVEEVDDELSQPIAPPQEALIFEPAASDEFIPETLFVDAEETKQIRAQAEGKEAYDWNRETENYNGSEFTAEHAAESAAADEQMVEAFDMSSAIPMPCDESIAESPLVVGRTGFETNVQSPKTENPKNQICPFCKTANDDIAFSCSSCCAVLSLADLELVLSNINADKYVIRKAVEKLEKEKNGRTFTEAELTTLGIGHLNLRNLQFGFDYLREASRLNPDNIMLASQVNALLIRIDEIRQQEEAHAALVKGKTILVVDDSATVRKLIAGKLEKSGHKVVCSADGDDALEQIRSTIPDLVLLDIAMPGMDGYQVCRQIRGWVSTAKTPVVMISGKDGFFDKMRGRMAGATGHITKPFGPETLMKAVEFYLGGGTDLDGDPAIVETDSIN